MHKKRLWYTVEKWEKKRRKTREGNRGREKREKGREVWQEGEILFAVSLNSFLYSFFFLFWLLSFKWNSTVKPSEWHNWRTVALLAFLFYIYKFCERQLLSFCLSGAKLHSFTLYIRLLMSRSFMGWSQQLCLSNWMLITFTSCEHVKRINVVM